MPYPENFAVRLILSLLLMFAIWMGIQYVMDVFIHHEAFHVGVLDFVIPTVCGVLQAFQWKPKE